MKIKLAKKEIIHFIGIGGYRYEWSFIDYEKPKVLKFKEAI